VLFISSGSVKKFISSSIAIAVARNTTAVIAACLHSFTFPFLSATNATINNAVANTANAIGVPFSKNSKSPFIPLIYKFSGGVLWVV
jgi:hypothetical protein